MLLEEAVRRAQLLPLWGHRDQQDTRTCFRDARLGRHERTENPHPHHAAWDAICQARDVQLARARIAVWRHTYENGRDS